MQKIPLPGLQRPVGAVWRLAGSDEHSELGPVVRLAGVLEPLPVAAAVVLAPAARVVVEEMHLQDALDRRERVHRTPHEHVPDLAVRTAVRDERLAGLVHLERDEADIEVGEGLAGTGAADEADEDSERQNADEHQQAEPHGKAYRRGDNAPQHRPREATPTRWSRAASTRGRGRRG